MKKFLIIILIFAGIGFTWWIGQQKETVIKDYGGFQVVEREGNLYLINRDYYAEGAVKTVSE